MGKEHFLKALSKTMQHEGHYSADKLDPGGETYMGISRVYWPDWRGWVKIDEWLLAGKPEMNLDEDVREFYRVNFWNRIQGDWLAEISPAIAYEVFDTAVNIGVSSAVKFLQVGHNIASGYAYELTVDGKLGPKTLEMISRYLSMRPGSYELNEEILLNCLNGEQYVHYKANPNHKHFRGWFRRV